MGIVNRMMDVFSSVRLDGWQSALMGYGMKSLDKRESTTFGLHIVDNQTAENLWRSNDIAARIVETIPSESLRAGFKLTMDDKENAEAITRRLKELKMGAKLFDAMSKERAFGGAAIFPVMRDDSIDLSQPLNENRVTELSHLQVFEPRELKPDRWYIDPLQPKFGEPETYRLFPKARGGLSRRSGVVIHETRMIIFPGIRVSRSQISKDDWGDSALQRPHDVLRDFGISWAAVGVMLTDFAQTVIKLKGLAELMALDKDEKVRNRLKAIELSRSTINATLLDADEDMERKQTPVAGLSELLDKLEARLAAAADMPRALLMGHSAPGLNNSGQSDIRWFYDRVSVFQELKLRDQVERLIVLVMLDRNGPLSGNVPESWSVEFNPLWQPSAKEKADERKVVADTDKVYWEMGAASAEEIARSRWGGDAYSPEMSIDFEERERIAEELEKEEAVALLAGTNTPQGASPDVGEAVDGGEEVTELEVEEVDTDNDPTTPADEFVTIPVSAHSRRVRLKRRGDRAPLLQVMTRLVERMDQVWSRLTREDKIEKRGDKYVVLSENPGEVLGEHDTREEAMEQLRAIEASKAA